MKPLDIKHSKAAFKEDEMLCNVGLHLNGFQPYTIQQEILTKEKFDEFDESFVSSIFNSSNFY